MKLQITRDHQTLVLNGAVNVHTAPALLQALRDKKTNHYTLDLGGVTVLDSAGVATLIEALHLAGQKKSSLSLKHTPACVSNAFELNGVSALFDAAMH